MYVIKTDNEDMRGFYFVKRCDGASDCVSFAGELSGIVKRYDTEQEALDEIDWLPEKAGPYTVEEIDEEE